MDNGTGMYSVSKKWLSSDWLQMAISVPTKASKVQIFVSLVMLVIFGVCSLLILHYKYRYQKYKIAKDADSLIDQSSKTYVFETDKIFYLTLAIFYYFYLKLKKIREF